MHVCMKRKLKTPNLFSLIHTPNHTFTGDMSAVDPDIENGKLKTPVIEEEVHIYIYKYVCIHVYIYIYIYIYINVCICI
jgi:hypothetical protein